MKVGIIGYPLSGKTSVFNTLTGLHARVDSYLSGGKQTNLGLIKVPDDRVDRLSQIFQPRKTIHIEITFFDLAGMGEAAGGSGFGAGELAQMRTVDAFTYVIRGFRDEGISHPLGSLDPARDIGRLDEELALADLLIIEKRLARLEKEGKSGSSEQKLLTLCREALDKQGSLQDVQLDHEEMKALSGFQFLSLKPRLILVNTGEDNLGGDPALGERFGREKVISFCAKVEEQISQLSAQEQKEFLEVLEIEEPARDKFIHAVFNLLGLISFYTVIKDEVRAWAVERGTEALDAAGKIHSDMQRGFIRAEVVNFEDFIANPSMAEMKKMGKLRLEGKNYRVADGDIIKFLFNV